MSAEQGREKIVKSVITCDMEGRIETFGEGAQEVFGYSADEIIGKQRVSLFSPGLVVLEYVGDWLKTAREEGEYKGQTVFLRKDGTPFAADVRITPTWKDGEQIGYCGVTLPRPDVPVEAAMPKIGLGTKIFRWLVITRAPFLTATIVPILIGAAWVAARGVSPFPWLAFALAMVGGIAMHVAANTFNDYFDWRSGTDPANNDYFMPLSGGSRSIELRLISEKALFWVASTALAIGVACGLALVALRGPALILIGLVGAFSVYFYTAPPLRLAARRGLGELFVGLNFGPLMVAGTVFALTGSLSWIDFFVGLPVGLLITAVLYINQFPDAKADEETGKINLVVILGKERARWGYLLIVFGAFLLTLGGVVAGLLPAGALLMLVALPIAVYTTAILFRFYADRRLVSANQYTIVLHMVSGLLLAAGVLWGERLIGLVS